MNKLGLTTISFAVHAVASYKVTIVANNLSAGEPDAYVRTLILDYDARDIDIHTAVRDILGVLKEELSR